MNGEDVGQEEIADDLAPENAVLPDFEAPVDESVLDYEELEGPPRRERRGRKPRGRRDRGAGMDTSTPRLAWNNPGLEWDEWMQTFPWGKDNTLRITLRRLIPTRWGGMDIAGIIDIRETTPVMTGEIRDTWGGGEYEAVVTGMHPYSTEGRPRPLARKRLKIAGNPIVNVNTGPREPRDAGGSYVAKTALDMVRQHAEPPTRLVEKTMAVVESAADSRAKIAETAARERVELAERQMGEERTRSIGLEARIKELEAEAMKRAVETQEKLSEVVAGAQNNSLAALMQLLPTVTGGAADQVKQMASFYEAREARAAAEYKSREAQVSQNFASQMDAQRTLFQAQQESLKAQFQSTITLLQQELQLARANEVALARRVDELRVTIDDKNKELLTRATADKSKSPVEQFTELGQMFEAMESMRSFIGGSQGAPPDDLEGVESPVTRKLLRMGEGLVQHAPAIVQALTNKNGGAVAAPPGYAMAPGGPAAGPPVYAPLPPVARPVRQHVSPHPPPSSLHVAAPPVQRRLKKEEVMVALDFVKNVLVAGGSNPTPAADVAKVAVMKADHVVLKMLTSRPPEKVIAELEAQTINSSEGPQPMLSGPLAEPEGKAYLAQLLLALRDQLASTE